MEVYSTNSISSIISSELFRNAISCRVFDLLSNNNLIFVKSISHGERYILRSFNSFYVDRFTDPLLQFQDRQMNTIADGLFRSVFEKMQFHADTDIDNKANLLTNDKGEYVYALTFRSIVSSIYIVDDMFGACTDIYNANELKIVAESRIGFVPTSHPIIRQPITRSLTCGIENNNF